MDQAGALLDRTLAPLDRVGRRGWSQYLEGRNLNRDIKPFLVQVWPQFGSRGQDEESNQRQKAERGV
jgi:hypothetical protein